MAPLISAAADGVAADGGAVDHGGGAGRGVAVMMTGWWCWWS